jgi:CheY-like chemotaxis protein/DNA-binding CsgD family transcriptional regulator
MLLNAMNIMQKHKPVVMIIDDTPDNLAILSDTLSESGYRVLVATEGSMALEQMAYVLPDIILLDVMMPGINGYQTCKQLKSNPRTSAIPVIFMTALSELQDLLRGFGEGAVDYLVKPVRPPEVLARVESQLNQARMIQRAEQALNYGPFSAMAATRQGKITWLPTPAAQWLREYLGQNNTAEAINTGAYLPAPIQAWIKQQMAIPENREPAGFEQSNGRVHFSARMMPCSNTDEFLILMERHSDQWNLDTVKSALGLTFREAEILMWISRGKTNKEVGLILGNSPRTINKHLEHVFEKLGVVTRAAAVSIALQRTSSITSETNLSS